MFLENNKTGIEPSKITVDPNLDLVQLLLDVKSKYDNVIIDFIICSEDDRTILVQKRSSTRKLFPNLWEFTGGKLDGDESILECIKTNLKKVAGMELTSVIGLAHQFVWSNDLKTINLVFLIRGIGKFEPIKDKISEYRYINKSEIDLLNEGQEPNNEIFKSAFFAFGFLQGSKKNISNTKLSIENYIKEIVYNFYEYLEADFKPSSIKVRELPDGSNISWQDDVLIINLKLLTSTMLFFAAMVILHDLYHNLKQGIKSHGDVLKLRDTIGNNEMLLIDIDADVEMYNFLVKYYNYDFKKYVDTLYEGGSVFRSIVARFPKVQRFIGSLISIYLSDSGKRPVIFPSFGSIYNELCLISITGSKLYFHQVEVEKSELNKIIDIAQNSNKYSQDEFYTGIKNFIELITSKLSL
jgi:hypothetical protein